MAKKKKLTKNTWKTETLQLALGGFFVFLGIFLVVHEQDTALGFYFFDFMESCFGVFHRWFIDPYITLLGIGILLRKIYWNSIRCFGLVLYLASSTSFVALALKGGVSPYLDLSPLLVPLLGSITSGVVFFTGIALAIYLTFRISLRDVLFAGAHYAPKIASKLQGQVQQSIESVQKELQENKAQSDYKKKTQELDARLAALKSSPTLKKEIVAPSLPALTKKIPIISSKQVISEDQTSPLSLDFGKWEFPPIQLLKKIEHTQAISSAEIEQKSLEIQRTLLQFKIDVEMHEQKVGPTVVQYRLDPADGVKLSKIESLKKDLALALRAKSIRIQAPIPGLALVGIEVPNDVRDTVGIREVLEHPNFKNHPSNLALAVGKDINGEYIVGDLAKMPHLLIAGQTGSGKSVGMNGFLLSLLYKNTPSQLRMILIDPKRVELGMYNGIPHLLTPVINDPDKALNALKWSVAEMLKRYDILQKASTRNLAEYNAKVSKKDAFPNIVIVIDELADLMMSGNKKEVESAIARIAQMARAVGMHIIVATQRPSVDVITGLIKANIPSRVAFTVASQIDSRTILDRAGAEDLLGRGDLLYFPTGASASERVQGVFVETEEVEAVVNHIRRTIDPEMLEDIYDATVVQGDRGNFEGAVAGGVDFDEDPKIIEEAILLVRTMGKGSTSVLQRKLKLGYARAARVMDILEEMGIVGPADGSKPREVYANQD